MTHIDERTRLDDKAVVITGSGRRAEQVAVWIRANGGVTIAQGAYVADRTQAAGLIERCVADFGRIDDFVNKAALVSLGRLQDHDELRLRRLLGVNVLAGFNCTAEAIIYMQQGSGSIMNVISGAHRGLTDMSDYAATKGAVASANYAWAADAVGTGVPGQCGLPAHHQCNERAAQGLSDRDRIGHCDRGT